MKEILRRKKGKEITLCGYCLGSGTAEALGKEGDCAECDLGLIEREKYILEWQSPLTQ